MKEVQKMRVLGIVRKIDPLGRVVIPKEVRDILGLKKYEPVEMLTDEKGVYIRKYEAGCTFCRGSDNLVEFGGTHVCRDCARKILGK